MGMKSYYLEDIWAGKGHLSPLSWSFPWSRWPSGFSETEKLLQQRYQERHQNSTWILQGQRSQVNPGNVSPKIISGTIQKFIWEGAQIGKWFVLLLTWYQPNQAAQFSSCVNISLLTLRANTLLLETLPVYHGIPKILKCSGTWS